MTGEKFVTQFNITEPSLVTLLIEYQNSHARGKFGDWRNYFFKNDYKIFSVDIFYWMG